MGAAKNVFTGTAFVFGLHQAAVILKSQIR
jgi:hypothetical protein